MLHFHLVQPGTPGACARIGQLVRQGKKAIETPNFIATTSRGVVPHVSPDTLREHTAVSGIYLGIEDFIEKKIASAPVFNTPAARDESRLRRFVAAQEDLLIILGPRRMPSLPAPAHNTNAAISICTSVGFRYLDATEYHDAAQRLAADITINMADIVTAGPASARRAQKSADRTSGWCKNAVQGRLSRHKLTARPAMFAAIPPVRSSLQTPYLQDLATEHSALLSGLAFYSSSSVVDLPSSLTDLPRFCISEPESPHALLKDILLGVDLATIPFLNSSSECGVVLDFSFDTPGEENFAKLPLGYDLWSPHHQTSLGPLNPWCHCFACALHHKAYLHHLLHAKEMLAWTLLQIHNHAILDAFFTAIRRSIARGTLPGDVDAFRQRYEAQLPTGTGLGPRLRGYQTMSTGGGESKKNVKAWGRLDDAAEKKAEAHSAGESRGLEDVGFANMK